jgi:hypothetical protein
LEAIAQIEKQRDAMKALDISYVQTVMIGDKKYLSKNSAIFDGNLFMVTNGVTEFSFDGENGWVGHAQSPKNKLKRLTKISLHSSDPALTYPYWNLAYFDAAGIYAPVFMSEVAEFASLEPLALRYLDESDPTSVEKEGQNLRVTFYVADRYLVNASKVDEEYIRKQIFNGVNPDQFAKREFAGFKRMRAMVPKRKVSMLLDSTRGFSVTEREDWTAAGQRICKVKTENWKLYESAGVWLPGRCVIEFFTTPTSFAEFADKPLQTTTLELDSAEFGRRNAEFVLGNTSAYKAGGTEVIDRGRPETVASGYTALTMQTVSADGSKLRVSALSAADNMAQVRRRRILVISALLASLVILPAVFIFRIKRKH